jgi:hypothetical protein
MRPPMLNRLRSPAKPAAAEAVTRPWNISCTIGEAMPSTPMPALTFRQSTAQSSQNWRVFHAASTGTKRAPAAGVALAGGVQPAGAHPGGGSR